MKNSIKNIILLSTILISAGLKAANIEESLAEISTLSQEKFALLSQQQKLTGELLPANKELQSMYATLQTEFQNAQNQIASLENQLQQAIPFKELHATSQQQTEALQKELSDLKSNFEQINNKNENLARELQTEREQGILTASQYNELKTQHQQLIDKTGTLETQTQNLLNQLRTTQNEAANLKTDLAQAQEVNQRLTQEAQKIQNFLEQEKVQLLEENNALKKNNQALQDEILSIQGISAELIKKSPGVQRSINSISKENMQRQMQTQAFQPVSQINPSNMSSEQLSQAIEELSAELKKEDPNSEDARGARAMIEEYKGILQQQGLNK